MTLAVNLKRDAVTAALEKIVAGREDYVYPVALEQGTCRYTTKDGAPSCIVGHVIAELAPDAFAVLNEYENENDESCGVSDLSWLGRDPDTGGYEPLLELTFDGGTVNALQIAQNAQDGTLTWGEALDYYRQVLADPGSYLLYTERVNDIARARRNQRRAEETKEETTS